jgi:hypothetical protein
VVAVHRWELGAWHSELPRRGSLIHPSG